MSKKNEGRSNGERRKGRIHARVFDGQFKAKKYREGVKEPIKNSIDADATVIHFSTTDRAKFVIRDNGTGATKIKREAIIDLGNSTSRGDPTKSGFFGSGRVHFAYPHAKTVTYLTAPVDEQDKVYTITIDMDTYFQRLRDEDEFVWEVLPKSRETWPFEHETGMVITYVLREEVKKMPSFKRGKELATLLSTTLPPYWIRKILIDGNKLPEREILGKPFSERLPVPQLDSVTVNLYRPKDREHKETLRIGGQQIGEVPFSSFLMMLDPDQRDQVPDIYTHPDCCGEILCPKFADHNVDSRESFAETLLNARWIPVFLSTLQRLAPKVEDQLGIQISKQAESGNDDSRIAERLARRLVERFGPVDTEVDLPPPDNDDEEVIASKEAAISLSLLFSHGTATRELEIGETVEITPVIRQDLIQADTSSPPGVEWDTDDCFGKVTRLANGSIRIQAKKVGAAKVVAFLSQQISTSCVYNVVEKREIRLNCDKLRINEGEKYRFRILNSDRLGNRKLNWSKGQGPGVLEVSPDGLSAAYVASNRGNTELEVSVNGKPFDRMHCSITVKSPHDVFTLIRIQDCVFRITLKTYGHQAIVNLLFHPDPDKPGDLIIDARSPLYQSLKAEGSAEAMDTVILAAVAESFVVKRMLQPDRMPTEDISPLTLDGFLQKNISGPMLELLNSLLKPTSTGKKASKRA